MLKGKKFNAFALKELNVFVCWHMPTRLLPNASKVVGICQQGCWQ